MLAHSPGECASVEAIAAHLREVRPGLFFFRVRHAASKGLMVERWGHQRGPSGGPGKERRPHRREGDTEYRNEPPWPHQQVLEYSCFINSFLEMRPPAWRILCLMLFSHPYHAPRAVSPANISEHDPVTRKSLQDGKGNWAPDHGRHQLPHHDLGSDDVRTGGRTSGGRDEGREGREGWRDGGWKPGPRPLVEGRYRKLSEPGLANPAGATWRERDRSPGRDGERGRERERGRSPRQEFIIAFPYGIRVNLQFACSPPHPTPKSSHS